MADTPELRRAAQVAPLVAADRVRFARELRGWTQGQLVEEAGGAFTTAALSQLERGHTTPSPSTLAAIAEAVDCPVDFFVARPQDRQREGFFRSLRAAPARQRRQHLADARLLHDFVAALEEHVGLPDLDVPRHLPETAETDEIEAIAEAVRDDWGLRPGPIPNVVRELERHGVVVVRQANFRREIDAFSVRYPGRPIVVLGSEKAATARSRFDAAHELGHLVMHKDADAGERDSERQAHEFAAAFLMPASDIRDHLPPTADWPALMQLKTTWRVSIAALLRRARTLEVMSQHRYVNAMKAMSSRGWRTEEPGDENLGVLEQPVLLRRATDRLASVGLTVEELADDASLPLGDIVRLLELTRDPRPSVDL